MEMLPPKDLVWAEAQVPPLFSTPADGAVSNGVTSSCQGDGRGLESRRPLQTPCQRPFRLGDVAVEHHLEKVMLRYAIDLLRRARGERSAYGEAPAGLSELVPRSVAQLRNTGFLRLDLRVSGGADPRGDGARGPCLA